jgi:hypothetical protein
MRQVGYYSRAIGRAGWPKIQIMIASIPRCGSTVMLRALAGLPQGSWYPNEPDCAFVRDLKQLSRTRFLKTHSIEPDHLPENVRAIFLFGDPIAAIVSTRNKRFDAQHFANCGYTGENPPDIYTRDDLGYEQIFDSWMTPHNYPVLAVRYETMFDHQEALSKFLGVPVRLPRQQPRTTEIASDLKARLSDVYGSLIEKVKNARDVQIIGGKAHQETP